MGTGETPVSQASEVCPVDEVDTPGKESDEGADDSLDESDTIPDHDGSYSSEAPPLPPRTPNPLSNPSEVLSPTTLAITTPRHRGGLMMCSKTQLERWRVLLDSQQSPCQPQHYNEDEPEDSDVGDQKEFLASHGMEAADESELSDSSLLETSPNYSEEVRRLLGQDVKLSTSLQAVMDGEDDPETSVLTPKSGHKTNKIVDNARKDFLKAVTSEDVENISPGSQPRRGVKRRSITEAGPGTPANASSCVQNTAIVFETDL